MSLNSSSFFSDAQRSFFAFASSRKRTISFSFRAIFSLSSSRSLVFCAMSLFRFSLRCALAFSRCNPADLAVFSELITAIFSRAEFSALSRGHTPRISAIFPLNASLAVSNFPFALPESRDSFEAFSCADCAFSRAAAMRACSCISSCS